MPLALIAPMVLWAGWGNQAVAAHAAGRDRLAVSTAGARHTNAAMWLLTVEQGKARRVAPHLTAYGFCFSPDGGRVAILGATPPRDRPYLDLYTVDLATGQTARTTTEFWGDYRCIPAWRPGTDEIAAARIGNRPPRPGFPDMDGGLWLVDLSSGHRSQLIAPSDAEFPANLTPRFSSDGNMLACMRIGGDAAVMEVENPARWLRLDQPSGPSGSWLRDWAWLGRTHTLLLAAHAGGGSPGGVWAWDTAAERAWTQPLLGWRHPETAAAELVVEWWKPRTAAAGAHAVPLFEQGRDVYAVAPSHDGNCVAYVTERGVCWRNLGDGESVTVHGSDAWPEVQDLRSDAEVDQSWPAAILSWSYDDRFLCLCTTDWAVSRLRVVDVASRRAVPSPPVGWWPTVVAWRPVAGGHADDAH